MNNQTKVILSVFLLLEHISTAGSLFCTSPQYIILGERGIIGCSFPNQFHTIAWYDSPNTTDALVTKIEKQINGTSEVSGDGFESGVYNICLNGSLIIPLATTYHDRTFKVVLIDENVRVSVFDIDTKTIVYPLQTTAAVNQCGTYDSPHCFVNSLKSDRLNCSFTGSRPPVTLTWYNNQHESLNVSTATFSDGNYTFTSFSSLVVSDYTDRPLSAFICGPSGPALHANNITTHVYVYNIQEGLENYHGNVTERRVILNSTLVIRCTEVLIPTVFVWGFKRTNTSNIIVTSANGNTEVTDNLDDAFEVSTEGALYFEQVDYSIEGLFTCVYLKDDVSSLTVVRVKIVAKDGKEEIDQTFPLIIVVVPVIVLIVTITGVLCCACFCVQKQRNMKKKQEYDLIDNNMPPCPVAMDETHRLDSSRDGLERNAVNIPDSRNKAGSSEEISVASSNVKSGTVEVDSTNTYHDPMEKSLNSLSEYHREEMNGSSNVSQDSTEESEKEEFFDAVGDVDVYNDAQNVNPESVKMLPLQSCDTEEENHANEKKDSANKSRLSPDEENDFPGGRTAIGAVLSNWRLKVDHEDKLVDSIRDLANGDHIVLSGWTLHPRCHGIVVDTSTAKNEFRLVRFTYEKGVIEEWMKWKPPIFNVTRYYIGDKSVSSDLFEADVVINRARSRINNDRLKYNIRTNNCKTFARWCKTGATPAGEFGYD